MSSRMKIIFLGTSDSVPSAMRNPSSIWFSYDGENILIDCGEGTQRQIRKAKLNPGKITKILITHWHGDHILGLPGLLQTMALTGYNKHLEIYGPKGTKEYMQELFRMFVFVEKFPVKVIEVVEDGKFFDGGDFVLEAKKVYHGIPSNAYSFVKKGNLRIDKSKLKKLKLQPGKYLQKLKEGKDVVIEGKKLRAKDLTYKDDEIKVSFILDTGFNKLLAKFVEDSEILVCESNFSSEHKEHAKDHLHLTSEQAATIAKLGNVKKLYLTHVSQRYEKDEFKIILKEARKIFKNTYLAEDLKVVEI